MPTTCQREEPIRYALLRALVSKAKATETRERRATLYNRHVMAVYMVKRLWRVARSQSRICVVRRYMRQCAVYWFIDGLVTAYTHNAVLLADNVPAAKTAKTVNAVRFTADFSLDEKPANKPATGRRNSRQRNIVRSTMTDAQRAIVAGNEANRKSGAGNYDRVSYGDYLSLWDKDRNSMPITAKGSKTRINPGNAPFCNSLAHNTPDSRQDDITARNHQYDDTMTMLGKVARIQAENELRYTR